ncbi:hypothetical protein GCM10022226_67980 [Sphaerisporangium flaviroseum]|uniref:Carbohydrate ABC transporter permease n=1 Tax=Sphaerisporangium flaviroseum TaxID=509199 RepID=A0ABP7J887_9ACTN
MKASTDLAGRGTRKVFFLTILAVTSAIFLYLFVWLVVASLKPRDRTFADPFLPWPRPFAPGNYIAFVFELKASWFDLMKPLIYLQDPGLYTLPRGLKAVVDQFYQGGDPKWELVLAASVITTLPLMVIFFIGQRYFVQGIATTGRRG